MMNYEEQFGLLEEFYVDEPTKQVDSNKCDICNIYLINYDEMRVCPKCGIFYEYDFVVVYNDYERCLLKQKSIYKRKAYLQTILKRYNIKK